MPQNLLIIQRIRRHGHTILYLAYRLNYLFHFFSLFFFQNIAIGYSFTEIKKIIIYTSIFDTILSRLLSLWWQFQILFARKKQLLSWIKKTLYIQRNRPKRQNYRLPLTWRNTQPFSSFSWQFWIWWIPTLNFLCYKSFFLCIVNSI